MNSSFYVTRNSCMFVFLVLFQLFFCFVDPLMSRAGDRRLVVNFELNSYQLEDAEKIKIINYLKENQSVIIEKMLVVGFTDSIGPELHNYSLSKKRAEAVRNEIMANTRSKATSVSVDGFGPNAPISNNKNAAGRARNRRAEVYLTGVTDRRLQHLHSVKKHNKIYIFKLIETAKTWLFKDQFDQALMALEKAARLGGKDYSDWHLTYAAVGFYVGRPLQQLEPIFQRALQLDPYNAMARDYLGRLKARQNFITQKYRPERGRTFHRPIRVESRYEIYEYLRLFKVKPRGRFYNRMMGIERWEGEDASGNRVYYYFDCSKIQAGAFYSSTNRVDWR